MKTSSTKFLLLLFCTACILNTSFAQQTETSVKKDKKKIVIITKKVDVDGKVVTEKIERDASDGDVFIFESDEPEIELDREMNVNVHVDGEDSNKHIKVKIIKDGESEVIEWEGGGDMPEDLKQELAEKGVEIHTFDKDHMLAIGNVDRFNLQSNTPKACLGVRIGHKIIVENINGVETEIEEGFADDGVEILGVIEDSGAESAGLLKDDIITSINGTAVTQMTDVFEVLGDLEPGTTVSIDYLRNGSAQQTNATLGDCGAAMIIEEKEVEVIDINIEGAVNSNTNRMVIIKKIEGEPNEIVDWNGEPEIIEVPLTEFENTLELEVLDIFPNPTEGLLRVQFEAPQKPTTVRVLDLSGKEIYAKELNSFNGSFNEELDLRKAAKGTLILSIQQEDKIFSEKVILQ